MARWTEDGSVAKPRGGSGFQFMRCLPLKQIEMDLATIMSAPMPDGNKRTRNRENTLQAKRAKGEASSGGAAQNNEIAH